MFRSSIIIRKLALNLAKVIFMVKHSAKLRRYFVAEMHCVQHTTHMPFYDMLPYNCIINNEVILLNVLT